MLSPRQAAAILDVSPRRVQEFIRDGRITAENIGTDKRPRYIVEEAELDRFAALDRPSHRPKETGMYIELEAPHAGATREDITTIMVGPFADETAARTAIDAAENVAWEPERRITGNGITLMARAITTGKGRGQPIAPHIPRDRDEFALLAYQYAR